MTVRRIGYLKSVSCSYNIISIDDHAHASRDLNAAAGISTLLVCVHNSVVILVSVCVYASKVL